MPNRGTAFVTGVTGGLGSEVAIHLARLGFHLVGCYRTNRKAAEALATEMEQKGIAPFFLQADVTNETEVKQLAGS